MSNNPPPTHPQANTGSGKLFRVFIQWFDTLFIMALCFATLLTTILFQKKKPELDYSVGVKSCVILVLLFAAYIWYMLTHSERELKDMVNHVYGDQEEAPPPAASADVDANPPAKEKE